MPPPPIHIDEPDKSLKKSGLATAASAAADELRGKIQTLRTLGQENSDYESMNCLLTECHNACNIS